MRFGGGVINLVIDLGVPCESARVPPGMRLPMGGVCFHNFFEKKVINQRELHDFQPVKARE